MWHKRTNKCQHYQQIHLDSERKYHHSHQQYFALFGPSCPVYFPNFSWLSIWILVAITLCLGPMNIHCIIPSSHLITDGQKISNNNVIDIHQQMMQTTRQQNDWVDFKHHQFHETIECRLYLSLLLITYRHYLYCFLCHIGKLMISSDWKLSQDYTATVPISLS